MTPRLQQAIKLLQYSHLEMVEHVQEAILENPTLEVVPDSEGAHMSDGERQLHDDAAKGAKEESDQRNGAEGSIDWERLIAESGQNTRTSAPSMSGGTIYDDLPPIETNLTYGESLADHLIWQLTMLKCGVAEESVCHVIIHNLDDRGYLAVSLEELAESESVDMPLALEALEIVQTLDPLGCGARDLCECLVIQSRARFPEDPYFERFFTEEHLRHLERRNYSALAKTFGMELEDVIEYHRMLQDFEPYPGRGFGVSSARYITPDIYVEKRGDEWCVLLNEDGMPDLRVSRYYQKVLQNASKKDKDYILDKLRGAEFLIKSINKRRKTIRRVTESILKYQSAFFDNGVGELRPLVLQEVADDIGVHMSTVSRVTSNKYLHTPHGLFELKYFFSAGVRQQDGEDMAAEAIKSKIRSLVQDEDKKKPLSDQAIANFLKETGVSVARRTVAKYREAMGILPSSKRKKMF
jgi:RNA polymerase sigma-54 factor